MIRIIFVSCVLLIMAASASAAMPMEAGLGFGYGVNTGFDQPVTAAASVSNEFTKSAPVLSGHFYVDPGWLPSLKVGGEIGYAPVYRQEISQSWVYRATAKYTAIPILAAAKYSFWRKLYGRLGLGVSLLKSSFSVSDATPGTAAALNSEFQPVMDALDGKVKFTGALAVGYSFHVLPEFSVDPRLNLNVIFAEGGSIKQFQPSLSAVYHF